MPLPEDERPTEGAIYDTSPRFDPYSPPEDAESVQPTFSPTPLSDPGADGDTSGADGEPQPAPQGPQGDENTEEEQEDLPSFDPKYREPFVGLLHLGRLSETFSLFGHTFVVRTLTSEQITEIGQITFPYRGTSAENAVYQSATVAAAVVSVDGQPLPGAITYDTTNELATVKFPYVQRNWMPPVREQIYNRVYRLELTSRRVLDALGGSPG